MDVEHKSTIFAIYTFHVNLISFSSARVYSIRPKCATVAQKKYIKKSIFYTFDVYESENVSNFDEIELNMVKSSEKRKFYTR